MEEKKYIKKRYTVDWNSLSMVKDWLEEMALKGYKLVEVKGGNRFLFEKIIPCKINYAVEVLPHGSIFDTHPSQKSVEYIDFCENAGWKYIDCTSAIYFFYAENEDVVAIETDEKLKFKTVKKVVFKGRIFLSIMSVILAFLNLFMNFTLNLNAILLSPIKFETNFLWILVLVLHSYKLIRYYLWTKKAKKIVNAGGKMPEEKKNSFWMYIVMLVVFAVIHSTISVILSVKYGDVIGYTIPVIWCFSFVIVFLSRWITIFAEKNKVGRGGHLVLQLVALPIICVILVFEVVTIFVGIIATDTEERRDIMIKKEDVAIFCPEADISEYDVEYSSYGNFILAKDRIYITAYSEDEMDMYDFYMDIYRSNNERVINRLIPQVNKFRPYSIHFEIAGATRQEKDGIVICETQTTEQDYNYLIYDIDTILCLYYFNNKLNEEQLEHLREIVLYN